MMLKQDPRQLSWSFIRDRNLLRTGLAAAILAVIVITLVASIYLRQQAGVRTAVATQNMANSIEQTVEGMIDTIDIALLTAADEISRQQATGRVDIQSVTRFLERQLKRVPDLSYLRATDEQGNVIYGPGVLSPPNNISDRDYFIRLRDDPKGDFLVSKHLVGRIAGKWAWLFIRRIHKSDGSFGGVVFGGVLTERIESQFSALKLDTGGVIALRDDELGLIARYTPTPTPKIPYGDKKLSTPYIEALKASPNEATFVSGATSIDGISRTHSYRRSLEYGFLVNVGIAGEAALADWRMQTGILAGMVVVFILSTLIFSSVITRAWRRNQHHIEELITGRQALSESEKRYRLLAENSHDVIWTIDVPTRRFTYVSPSVEGLRGYSPAEVVAQPIEAALTPESAVIVTNAWRETVAKIAGGERTDLTQVTQVDQPHRDGHIIHTEVVTTFLLDDAGKPASILGVSRDITERKKAQQALEKLAQTDMLTGLANRRHFMMLAEQELSRMKRYGGPLSVFMMDIDHFKDVNDTYGHQIGDLVLQKLGGLCREALRDIDRIGRIGGEEFAVVLPQTDGSRALEVAERVRQTVENTEVALEHGRPLRFTLSIGVVTLVDKCTNIDALLGQADSALYEAKHLGRNRVCVYGRQP